MLGDKKTWTSAQTSPATLETYGRVYGGIYTAANLKNKGGYWISADNYGARGITVTFDREVKVTRFSVQCSKKLRKIIIIQNFYDAYYVYLLSLQNADGFVLKLQPLPLTVAFEKLYRKTAPIILLPLPHLIYKSLETERS